MLLKDVKARKIKDSRGEDTIEVEVNGCKASSPSGKSTGKYETPQYYKNIDFNIIFLNKTRFDIEVGKFSDLKKVEDFIKNKLKFKDVKQFGANALFALESAILKTIAKEQRKELYEIVLDGRKISKMPIPVGNAVGGGLHSSNKDKPSFQEFLLIPLKKNAYDNVKIMNYVYLKLGRILKSRRKNDEGAWETGLNEEDILKILSKFKEINIGVDAASSSFYKSGGYCYKNKCLTSEMQLLYINSLIKEFNLFYIEDPLQEEEFVGFSKIEGSYKNLVVGDDLTATHLSRLKKAIKMKSINAIIVKPNQNGSLLELKEICGLCRKKDIKIVVSHRSGETMDDALADYAVGFGADFIKCGISTKWREAKLKRLVEIERIVKK